MSFSNTLLQQNIKSAFNLGYISEGMLPNDHPLMRDNLDELAEFAKLIGIDFAKTGSTFRLSKSGYVNSPELKSYAGQPVIEWGNVRKPLVELLGISTITCTFSAKEKAQKDKGFNYFLTVESDELGRDGQSLHSYVFSVAAESNAPKNLMIKSFDNLKISLKNDPELRETSLKALNNYLRQQSVKLKQLPVGKYKVVWFGDKSQYGYSFRIDTGEKFFANNGLSQTFDNLLAIEEKTGVAEISEEKPAFLEITGHEEYMKDGRLNCKVSYSFDTASSLAKLEESKVYKPAAFTPAVDNTEFEFPEHENDTVVGIGDLSDIPF